LGAITPKSLKRLAKICYDHLCLRDENTYFKHQYPTQLYGFKTHTKGRSIRYNCPDRRKTFERIDRTKERNKTDKRAK